VVCGSWAADTLNTGLRPAYAPRERSVSLDDRSSAVEQCRGEGKGTS
jgi:hypothetical protein